MLEAQGYAIQITWAMRTWAQQDSLYAQGRTIPGPIVTHAQGGYSNHNFGLCFDCCPFVGKVPDWDNTHIDWKAMVALAPSCGLRDGISFQDEPHLELVEIGEVPTDEMRQTFRDAGVQAVWDELNIPTFGS